MEEDEKKPEDYTLTELQEALDNLFEKFFKFKGESKQIVSRNYSYLARVYNTKVGYQAYRTKL